MMCSVITDSRNSTQVWGSFFVYTMSQVQICACTRIFIWRMYIIELLSEMMYKVYESSRSHPTRL